MNSYYRQNNPETIKILMMILYSRICLKIRLHKIKDLYLYIILRDIFRNGIYGTDKLAEDKGLCHKEADI